MEQKFAVEFGVVYVDKITGFKGTCTGVAAYTTGCNKALLSAKAKDEHSEPVSLWLDEQVLEPYVEGKKKPGGGIDPPV